MAIAVRGYYEVSDWMATATSAPVTGVGWTSGDVIVVAGWLSDVSATVVAPTNANLTFTSRLSAGSAGLGVSYIYTAKSTSTETSQTIAGGRTGSTNAVGSGVWVLSGADDYTAGATSNRTDDGENPQSMTVSAGSAVIGVMADWNATGTGSTGLTGSGTQTDREADVDGTYGGVWAGGWVGTASGTFDFGVDDYTGFSHSQCYAEIAVSAATGATVTPSPVAATASVTTVTPSSGSTIAAVSVAGVTSIVTPTVTGSDIFGLTAITFDDDRIDLAWTDEGSDEWQIERDDVIIDTAQTNSYADTGLDPATLYSYRVRGVILP